MSFNYESAPKTYFDLETGEFSSNNPKVDKKQSVYLETKERFPHVPFQLRPDNTILIFKELTEQEKTEFKAALEARGVSFMQYQVVK